MSNTIATSKLIDQNGSAITFIDTVARAGVEENAQAIDSLTPADIGAQPAGNYALKSEIPSVPTKISQLSDDSTHRVVTDTEKAAWNAKSNFSGSYNDLTNKPTIPTVPVQSVNGKTGAVKLTASDVGAQPAGSYLTTETDPTVPSWAKATTKPSYTKSEVGLANVDNVKQYSASNPPPYPVTSVNGKTGAVTLSAADVGAATTAQFSQLSAEIVD